MTEAWLTATNMKSFIYLVQGEKKLVQNYLELSRRPRADAIYLTYDEPLDGAIFYPDSTWAQGRNKLLDAALQAGEYLYYVFCDDDIAFKRGSWQDFEECLLTSIPAVGVPIVPRTVLTRLKFPKISYQPFFINDEQLIAFHKDVVKDQLVVPYVTQYDDINWWISCEIQQILIQNFYPLYAIQFNDIQIQNTCRERYQSNHGNDKDFRTTVKQWIKDQLREPYNLTARYTPPRYHAIMFRKLAFSLSRNSGNKTYTVKQDKVFRQVLKDSELFKRYCQKDNESPIKLCR